MNQIMEVLKARRTTRKFEQDQIKDHELEMILEAGIYAPSAHNMQPWHFTVIQDKDLLSQLNADAKEIAKHSEDEMIRKMGENEKFNIFYNAPTIILVSGKASAMMPVVDCAAATQNMLIAAESIDLGACWNGMVGFALNGPKKEEYMEKLNIPSGYNPYYAVVLGYKAARATNAPKRAENTVQYIR
tara:strand:+ start:159 stop:719 length:561 start_codon:yes stop_codon:yes gene_type:complete